MKSIHMDEQLLRETRLAFWDEYGEVPSDEELMDWAEVQNE